MPHLKQLSCTVHWADTEIPFQEYGTVYGDGVVESYIVVPNKPQPFTIRLKSLNFIYEGLAMVVFIDGNYQSNRNRVNLKPIKKKRPLGQSQIDFLVRQKEKPLGEGVYMGRKWRFDYHNVVEDLPQGVKESHFDSLGTIEILVLRCQARVPAEAEDSGSSSAADSDALGENGERRIFDEEEETTGTTKKPSKNDGMVEVEEEEVVDLMSGLPFGGDATNDYNHPYPWNGTGQHHYGGWPRYANGYLGHGRSQSQHHPSASPNLHHQPPPFFHVQNTNPPGPEQSAPQKHVRFDLNTHQPATQVPDPFRPPSYERLRRPLNGQPQPLHNPFASSYAHPVQAAPTVNAQPFTAPGKTDIPNGAQHHPQVNFPGSQPVPQAIPMPTYGMTPYTAIATYPYHSLQHPQSIPQDMSHFYRPPWQAHPPHLLFNPYQHPQSAAWLPPAGFGATNFTDPNKHPSPATVAGSSKGSNDPANNQQQNTYGQNQDFASNNWNQPANDTTSGNDNNNNNNGTNVWDSSNQNSGNAGGWSNNSVGNNQTGGGNQTDWNNNWETSNNNNLDTSNDNSWDTFNNNENSNNNSGQNDANKDDWNNDGPAQINSSTANDAGADVANRPLFGPHGQYYTYFPKGTDEPGADVEEEPRYDVPKKITATTGSTKQVLPGSGYMYWKKRRAPEYIDSLEEPYARFVFKYRTKDQLEKEIGIRVEAEPTGDEAAQEFQAMDKQSLVELLVRAKSALGGKVPSPRLKSTTPASENDKPVAIDPPNRPYLDYKLPESGRRMSENSKVTDNSNGNKNGSGGGNDDWNSGGDNNNTATGGWGSNNNDNSNGGQWGNNDNNNWESGKTTINHNNTNWNRAGDGASEQNHTTNTGGTDQSSWQNNSSAQHSSPAQQCQSDSNAGGNNNFNSGSAHSSPSTLPLDPFNPSAPQTSPKSQGQSQNTVGSQQDSAPQTTPAWNVKW